MIYLSLRLWKSKAGSDFLNLAFIRDFLPLGTAAGGGRAQPTPAEASRSSRFSLEDGGEMGLGVLHTSTLGSLGILMPLCPVGVASGSVLSTSVSELG